jgi:hypothetical protein
MGGRSFALGPRWDLAYNPKKHFCHEDTKKITPRFVPFLVTWWLSLFFIEEKPKKD